MKKKKSRGIKWIIILILLLIIVVAGIIIGREIFSHKVAQKRFKELSKEISNDSKSGRDLDALFKKNKECIGWVCIKKTAIDYPVMHTPNDPKKYLYKNFNGQYSSSGTPFLDARCTINSSNCILYGHNMRNGQLFASLKQYLDKSYYKKYTEVEFQTKNGDNFYKIFAVVALKQDDEWYNFIDAPNSKNFKKNITGIMEKALYTTGVKPKFGQQLLTLSTCYGSDEDGRLIVVAVKKK